MIWSIAEFTTDALGLTLSLYQKTLLKAIYGEPLDATELEVFKLCTGRESYTPGRTFSEVTIISGRQSGKDSRIACPIVCYEAVLGEHEHLLEGGAPVRIVLVAQDAASTDNAFSYIRAGFERPDLKPYVKKVLTRKIELKSGLAIECFACTKSSMRGRVIPCGVMDELGFFRLEGSANSDVEVQEGLKGGQLTVVSPKLVKISTPYMKSGVLHDDFKSYYGSTSEDVLVWQSTSGAMNPKITSAQLARAARTTDSVRYRREYEAIFSEDLTTFLSDAWIDSAIATGVREIPPSVEVKPVFAVDTSGGGADAFTLAGVVAVGRDADRHVTQVVMRGWEKPRVGHVSLEGAVKEISDLVKSYGVSKVYGDRFTGRVYVEMFQRHGITYEFPVVKQVGDLHPLKDTEKKQDVTEVYMDRSMIYLEAESFFAQGRIKILDHAKLTRELRNLERRPSAGGKDKVDHPRGQHDDYSVALCLAAVMSRGGGLPKPVAGAVTRRGPRGGNLFAGRGGFSDLNYKDGL